MTQPASPQRRVRVTRSRRSAGRVVHRPLSTDLDEQTGLGDVYLAGLMRAQLRLSLLVLTLLAVGLGGLPLLLLVFPSTRSLSVGGVPFPWLVLGVLTYPVMWGLARWYAAQSGRIERQFRDVMGES